MSIDFTRSKRARLRHRGSIAAIVIATALSSATAGHASSVTDVNASLLAAIRSNGTPPPRAARAIAMVGTAMFDSVNAATGLRYDSYQYAGSKVTGVSADAAAYAAGYTMLANLFPGQSAALTAEMNMKINSLGLSAARRAGSIALGSTIATSSFNGRLVDGSATAQSPYVFGTDPGDFQSTNGGGQPAFPGWGSVTPFAMTSGDQFRLSGPPALGSAAFITDYEQVRTLGCATCGTAEQQAIATFWADGGGTVTPPGHWLEISTGLMLDLDLGTMEAARLTALVGASVADAGISAWDNKYTSNFWRPVTAINNCTELVCGVAGEPGWVPYLTTPNFPTYSSGHSTFSGSAAGALESYFGSDSFADFCFAADPLSGILGDRCFGSFSAAAAEAGISRIYGGIHFEFDDGDAVTAGQNIGRYVGTHFFQLTAVPEPENWAMLIAGFGLVGATMRRRRSEAVAA
ncbi:MAG: hypothetical protein DCF31_04075 [Alphaproteobacteria bacterium]|nr:MAG: hypothetical protein DCF31_04075 [Alphaproteobacteria bacterium]